MTPYGRADRKKLRQERALARLRVAAVQGITDYDFDDRGRHGGREQNQPEAVHAAIAALEAKGIR